MAVHDKNTPQSGTPETNQEAAARSTQQPQGHGLFGDFGSLFTVPINSSQGSELLINASEKIEEQVKSILKGADKNVVTEIIQMDREINKSISHSIIVVTMTVRNQPQLGVSYHSIVLEGSAEEQEVTHQTIAGMNVEVRRMASDALNQRLIEEIRSAVKQRFGDRRLHNAEYSLMPRDFDLDDEVVLRRFTANALMACRNILAASAPNWRDMNIQRDLPHRENLNARVTYARGGEQPRDDAGLPVRSDVRIDLSTPDIHNHQQDVRADLLTTVSGFVDLVYAPAQQSANPYSPQSTGPLYFPRFIITGFDSVRARSLGSQLLALANAILLYSNNDALMALYPNTSLSSNETDMHDIGTLNYEARLVNTDGNFGYVDLKSASVTPQDIAQYMSALIRPTFELGMDISSCGADTWVRSPFAASALGNAQATQSIVDAANQLSNGVFAQNWQPGAPIARVDSRVILGKYTDQQGRWRDIRDVDYLAVMGKFGDKNMNAVLEWSNAKTNTSMNPDQSAFIQRRTIESIVGVPTYTGYGLRIIFNPKFLEALSHSLKMAGLGIRLHTPSMSQMQQRYIPTNIPQFDPSQIVGGLAQAGFSNQQTGYNYGYSTMGRFDGYGR